jgi:hypothetical protein
MSFSATTAVNLALGKVTLRIIGETSIYPSNALNAYTVRWAKDQVTWDEFLTKTEYGLYQQFKCLRSFICSPTILTNLAEAIEKQIETERSEADWSATYEG